MSVVTDWNRLSLEMPVKLTRYGMYRLQDWIDLVKIGLIGRELCVNLHDVNNTSFSMGAFQPNAAPVLKPPHY